MHNYFKTFSEVISFAIMREEEAYQFYMDLATKTDDLFMKEIFQDFAEEEMKHAKLLKDLDANSIASLYENIVKKIDELNISQTVGEIKPAPDMDFKELLAVAMKREEKSEYLYSFLAETSEDNDVSLLFIGLAKEEAQHKLRIEKTYKQIYGDFQ